MDKRIILPRILGFRLHDFHPIFNKDISMKLSKGPNIILGGNGLGKTTIIQAVVYGLTGGNASFEQTKSNRWNHTYFRKRLNNNHISSALIEVDFAFGKEKFSIRRGVNSSHIIAFKSGDAKQKWEESSQKAKKAFEISLRAYGGYENSSNFDFFVHRVLYLPENRRLLAWDNEAQLRAIMLLNQDMLIEESFRKRKDELQDLDTKKRHTGVALGKVIKGIKMSADRNKKGSAKPDNAGRSLKELVKELSDVSKQRRERENENEGAARELSLISSEVEELREQIEQRESQLVAASLASKEKKYSLALFKLTDRGICPACGTLHQKLQALAHKHLAEHKCLLCGSGEEQPDQPELTTLRSQLTVKKRTQKSIEKKFLVISSKLKRLAKKEDYIQNIVNKKRFSDPNLLLIERGIAIRPDVDLGETKIELENTIADIESQIHAKQLRLEKDYKEFRKSIDDRISQLRQLYSKYATLFLGIECKLIEAKTEKLVALTRFIPSFNEILRETPESCSEAQRFFLDIAFRMALIDFATKNNISEPSVFVCETPETALDLSYISNVVSMFADFSKKGHSLLLSSNIQNDGIAGELLKTVPAKSRKNRVLNLLDFGQLSGVQKKAEKKLRSVVQKLF